MFKILSALASLYQAILSFIKYMKTEEIIQAKNKALEGDQRELEKLLSDNPVSSDDGLSERSVKNRD